VTPLDAIVVGAGPNGLSAAVTLAQSGLHVRVYEAAQSVGGGARTLDLGSKMPDLPLPGFRYDPCSAVHPLGAGSPVFRSLPLARYGLEWIRPDLALAHPFPDGTAAVLSDNPEDTARSFGLDADRDAYLRLIAPFLGRWEELAPDLLRPPLDGLPGNTALTGRFLLRAAAPAALLDRIFHGERARGLLAGLAAHAVAPLTSPGTAGVALMFALAGHEVGWPFPRGGAQAISDALAKVLTSLGGLIETGHPVRALGELPPARAYLLDTSPPAMAALAGPMLPARYAERLMGYQYGPAVFKIDYALSGPVPWTAEPCRRAGTVHLGASQVEIGAALRAAHRGNVPRPPFLIAAQPSLFDPTRAPAGMHVFWVYAHVPHDWHGDLTAEIEARIERFAPGFRDLILLRQAAGPEQVAAQNPNNVGGDIAGGRCDQGRLLLRPSLLHVRAPYSTPNPAVYLCSSSTPPGPGVHGMCGYHAARAALRRVFGLSVPADPRPGREVRAATAHFRAGEGS
jgi:phytoene dehydrogenase-like protein